MGDIQRSLREEIATYAKANGFDLILVNGVGYVSPALDVTAPLLEAMKKKSGVATPAAAPAAQKPPAAAPAPKSATPAK